GTYIFNSIQYSGSNRFRFDFQNSATGVFLIYVHGDVDLNKSKVLILNGGDASRIYAETHGTGASSPSGTVAWNIANGSSGNQNRSKWSGTIYAPYAAIKIGSGSGSSNLTGAFWSGTQVTINSGVSLFYDPFIFCSPPTASAGTDKLLTCAVTNIALDGSASTAGATYSWQALNGGNIVSGSNTINPVVNAAGSYIITVTASGGCSSSDTVNVSLNNTPPDVNAGSDMVLTCQNTSVTIDASSTNPSLTYSWTGPGILSGANSSSATVNLPGVYTVVVTDTHNGCTASDQTTVTTNTSIPDVDAGPPNALNCILTQLELLGSSNTASALFSWTFSAGGVIDSGETTATPYISGIATYYLTVTDSINGCTALDSVEIFEGPCILPYYAPCPDGKVQTLIGCELSSLYNNYIPGSDTVNDIYIFGGDSVWIEIITIQGQTQNLFNLVYQTTGYGLTDTIPNGLNPLIITGKYPIANLPSLEVPPASNMINYVRPVYPALTSAGVTTTQGDVAQKSDFARNGFNVDGTGVKVCVLSDSYNKVLGNPAQADILNGDLPGVGSPNYTTPVDVIQDYPYGAASDEGRAMLQIVHDIAPGAELGFRTGTISEGDLALGIIELAQAGCNVIADDITFITSPFFQDGVIAKAVDSVTSMGVKYFVAAGNFDSKSYQNQYSPMAAPLGLVGTAHDFGSGDNLQSVTLEPGAYTVMLQWEDSIYSLGQTNTGTVNDFDIYITNEFGTQYFGFNHVNTGGDPYEVLPFIVPGVVPIDANFTIVRASGNQAANIKFVIFRG
ncbi:MAG: hypothetical protein HKO56_03985, partial [Bacteroidia bacterium]|nr:hypothetical protein [Bacteroidia bacterium]